MSKYHIECLPEEVLLLNLGLQRDSIVHHSGSGSVCSTMNKGKYLIGLIDEDPDRRQQHPYYDKLYRKPSSDKYNIRFSEDNVKKNKIVFIKPRFEPWIIQVAQQSGLRMSDFDLSDDPDLLHREINFKKTSLQRLIHKLKRVQNPAILRLKELLNP